MADEIDAADIALEEDVATHTGEATTQRTYRIEVGTHDTPKAKTEEIIALAKAALEAMPAEHSHKDVATWLKRKLDAQYKGTWHVIVGTHFGANVTNDAESLVNVKVDGVSFLVLRSGPPDRPLAADGDAGEETA